MFSLKRFVAVGVAAATIAAYSALQPCPAKADEGAVFGDITVTQASATPAQAGETTIVTFTVENSGSDRVLITGLRMPAGEPSRIMGAFGQGQRGEIGALPVRPGGTEALDGGTIWIEVGPLAHDLKPDSTVAASLVLGSYESPLALHVGPVATGSTKATDPRAATIANQSPEKTDHGTGC
jgi:hypothetical protein